MNSVIAAKLSESIAVRYRGIEFMYGLCYIFSDIRVAYDEDDHLHL